MGSEMCIRDSPRATQGAAAVAGAHPTQAGWQQDMTRWSTLILRSSQHLKQSSNEVALFYALGSQRMWFAWRYGPSRNGGCIRCRGKRKQILSLALFGRASFAREDFPPRVLVAADSTQRLFRRRLLEHIRPISCFAARETTLLSMLPGIITD